MNRGWLGKPPDGSESGWSVGLFLSICLSMYLSVYLSVYLSICLSIVCLSICLSIYQSVFLSICPITFLCLSLSIYLSICKPENEAILRDLIEIWKMKAEKRNFSARLPSIWKLTTSKTLHFCETSSINRSCQHQKRSISARRPSKMESWVLSWQPCANAFCDFLIRPL